MRLWYDTHWRDFYATPRIVDMYASRRGVPALICGGERRLYRRCLALLNLSCDSRIVDLCCGTGGLAIAAADRIGPQGSVWGIDLAPRMLDQARLRRGDRAIGFKIMDAQRTDFAPQFFDAVSLIAALHEMPGEARARVLGEALRLLRPGGKLLVGEHLVSGGAAQRCYQQAIFRLVAKPPEREYFADLARRGLGTEIEQAGFRIVDDRPLPGRLFHLVLATRPRTD